jgi:Uma2 family endonuclease
MTAVLNPKPVRPTAAPSLFQRERELVREDVIHWVWPRPLTFEQFLDLFMGREEIVELVDGVVVEHLAAQLDHERTIVWLLRVLSSFVEERDLGEVLGSRTAVEISTYRGRLPDILFVRKERVSIVQQRAIYGPPDLVIEVVSPGDRRADRVALETDYTGLGVEEIVFIDLKRRRVRILRNRPDGYEEQELTDGNLNLEVLGGTTLKLAWLFEEPRPTIRTVMEELEKQLPVKDA